MSWREETEARISTLLHDVAYFTVPSYEEVDREVSYQQWLAACPPAEDMKREFFALDRLIKRRMSGMRYWLKEHFDDQPIEDLAKLEALGADHVEPIIEELQVAKELMLVLLRDKDSLFTEAGAPQPTEV